MFYHDSSGRNYTGTNATFIQRKSTHTGDNRNHCRDHIMALLLLFTIVIPRTAEHGAEKRSERFDTAVNNAVNQAMENVQENGTIFQKEPSVPMSPGLLAIEKPFEEKQELEAQS